MHKTITFTLFFLLFTFVAGASQGGVILFQTGNLEQLKTTAAREGKLMYIHFTASWCMPCQWMEKNTYADLPLANYINKNFFPVKVDIDERDGYRAKENYRVILLPSVLIIDTRGLVVGRYEESMTASRLLQVLQQHQTQEGGAVVADGTPALSPPSRPKLIVRPALVPESGAATTAPTAVGPTPVRPTPVAPTPAPTPSNQPVKFTPPTTSQPAKPPSYRKLSSPLPATDNGSLSLPPASPPAASPPATVPADRFSIQVGVFSNYENALRQMQDLETKVNQPVKVFISKMEGLTVYRLLVGTFEKRSDAEAYLRQLDQNTIKGMVKDLSEL